MEVSVGEIGIEFTNFGEFGETFIDNCPVGEGYDGKFVTREVVQFAVDSKTEEVAASKPAVFAHVVRSLEDGLANLGNGAFCAGIIGKRGIVNRDVGPVETGGTGKGGDSLNLFDALLPQSRFEREEEHSEGDIVLDDEFAMFGKSVDEESPGDIELESGAVPGRASVVKVFGESEGLFDQFALSNALARGKESDAARIGFENGTSVSLNWIHSVA